ncbi:MASE2 domain-containing protein, partial [Leptospira sp. SA-E8]|uniref:MASE2 domain-containing protein n=1 Tax=Leptospira sp. SA-E8 TaxID=3422259 RepID=UPI003EC0695E
LIRNNHINRTYLLALLGLACGSHLWDLGGASPVTWALLVLSCYVWPHLAWWLALRSDSSLRAEQRNFLVETALAGAWAAAFGFPVWLSVVFVVCNSINFVVFHGVRIGLPRLVAALGLGAALVWFSGLHYPLRPGTGQLTTVLCILALTSYIVLLSESTHRNARLLRKSNRMLREQYEEIQALQSLLQEQTLHDPLTGLYNRRHLDDVLTPK